MPRYEDLPPHLRPVEQPHLIEELPLLEDIPPPPDAGPHHVPHEEPPRPAEPFLRR
jgi:hypothetical protein